MVNAIFGDISIAYKISPKSANAILGEIETVLVDIELLRLQKEDKVRCFF
jgi:hypothetical protein